MAGRGVFARNEEAEPGAAFELRETHLRRCRDAGEQGIPLRRGDRKRTDLVGFDLRHGQRQDIEHHGHVAGDEVLHRRRSTAIRYVNDVDSGCLLELLSDDVP